VSAVDVVAVVAGGDEHGSMALDAVIQYQLRLDDVDDA